MVRSDVRITASVTAGYLTIEGGEVALVVVDESGAVMETLGDAAPVMEGQESYSFVFDSTMFPNGALRLAVLATDAFREPRVDRDGDDGCRQHRQYSDWRAVA